MTEQRLIYTQKIPAGIDEVWDFFTNPENLVRITPQEMHMRILNQEEVGSLYPGMTIIYKLYPFFDFPVRWSTEIQTVDRPHEFSDEQKSGPYEFWRHRHLFSELSDGVEMTDIIEYKISFGFLGEMLDQLLVHSRLDYVFSYRRKKIEEIFRFAQRAAS